MAGDADGRLELGIGVEYVGDGCSEPSISTSSCPSYDWNCRGVYDPRLAGGGRTNCSDVGVELLFRLFSAFNFATQSSRYRT